jgi:hypothetical protein
MGARLLASVPMSELGGRVSCELLIVAETLVMVRPLKAANSLTTPNYITKEPVR